MPTRRKFLTAVISVFILFSVLARGEAFFAVSALSVSADSAILIDGKSGKVLFTKNPSEVRPMASTTKIMTAVVAIESGSLERTVRIPAEAVGIEGSSIYLCEGEELTLRQLLYALLLASANDAAAAIAIYVGGSIEGFAALMNEKAAALGLRDTHFDNPHGLDSPTHYTTAADLASLAAYAMTLPEFREIVSQYKKLIPMAGDPEGRLVVNHNKLLRSYSGAVGVKTGFTKKSGRCLVSAAERDGMLLIAVTLAAPNDWQDHTAMLDYGFSNYSTVELDGFCPDMSIPVVSGEQSSVICGISGGLSALLPKEHGSIVCRIERDRFLYAPVDMGESVGVIFFYCDGALIGKAELYARQAVSLKPQKYTIWDRIGNLFAK